jgi:hypothetical protein
MIEAGTLYLTDQCQSMVAVQFWHCLQISSLRPTNFFEYRKVLSNQIDS